AHFSGNVRQHLVLAFQFHPEHGVRQRFNDRCHDFNRVFFAHYLLTKTSLVVGSWSLALGRWLLVVGIRFWPMTNDQKPPTVLLRQNHRAIFCHSHTVFKVRAVAAVHGDCGPLVVEDARAGLARVHHRLNCNDHAFFQLWPIALHAKVGDLRFFVKPRADAMSDKFSYYAEAVGFDVLLHGGADISYCVSYPSLLNALVERRFSHFEQLLQFRRELAIYRDGYRRVSVVAVKHYAAINRNNVARLQYPLGGRDPVHNFFIDRSTEHAGIIVISLERRFRAQIFNLLFGGSFEIHGADARGDHRAQMIQNLAHNAAASPHLFNLRRRLA